MNEDLHEPLFSFLQLKAVNVFAIFLLGVMRLLHIQDWPFVYEEKENFKKAVESPKIFNSTRKRVVQVMREHVAYKRH